MLVDEVAAASVRNDAGVVPSTLYLEVADVARARAGEATNLDASIGEQWIHYELGSAPALLVRREAVTLPANVE